MSGTEQVDVWSQFGDGGSTGGQGFEKAWRPVDNDTIEVGIFPQMGEAIGDPRGWHLYQAIHWGYTIVSKSDPTKKQYIKFNCVKKFGRGKGVVVQECPKCLEVDEVQSKRKEAEGSYQASKSKEEIKLLLKPIDEWLRKFNSDRKQIMFARNAAGDHNKLALSNTTFKLLEAEMDQVEADKKINPRNPRNMLMLRIKRIGSSKDRSQKIVETVAPAQEVVQLKLADGTTQDFPRIKIVQLDEVELRRALTKFNGPGGTAGSLADDDVLDLTVDEVMALVASSGDPEEVERICSRALKVQEEKQRLKQGAKARAVTPPPAAPPVQPATASSPPTMDTTAGVVGTSSVVTAAAPPATPLVQPTPVSAGASSEADLFARLKIKPENLGLKPASP